MNIFVFHASMVNGIEITDKKNIDAGTYNRDQTNYDSLVKDLYENHDPITLDATYSIFLQMIKPDC
jgi:hypothetical protein